MLTHAASGADYGGDDVAAGSVTATTVDNDPPRLRVAPTALALIEEGASDTYTVRLNALPTGLVTVTVGGAGSDVAVNPPALTFTTSTWSTLQSVTVRAPDDADATSATTTLTHAVAGASEYRGLPPEARPNVQVRVADNDTQGIVIDADLSAPGDDDGPLVLDEGESTQYTVSLETQPTGPVTVTVTSPDPAALAVGPDGGPLERTLTFSTSTWDTAQTVTARAVRDDDGGDESVAIAHEAAGGDYGGVTKSLTARVADADERGVVVAASTLTLDEGGMASSTVLLATQPTGAVAVAITADHAGVTVLPPTMLTFSTSTWNTAQAFTIRAGQDDDGRDETATLTLDPSGADYNDVPFATSTVNVRDNNPRGVTLSASSVSVPEGGSTEYTVRLDTQPVGGDVTVMVGGVPALGISASPTALTFTGTNWRTPQTVTVSAAEDDGNAATESATLTHAVSGADYGREGVAADSVTATTTDNDSPSLYVVPTALALAEGATSTYAVRLNTQPTGAVTVAVGGAGGSVSVSPAALTFTTSTWSALQTVTVSALADDDATNATTTLTHAVAGADYAGLPAEARPGVDVTVNDPDTQGIEIDANPATPADVDGGPLVVIENQSAQYTVRLATRPIGPVTVTATSADPALEVDVDGSPLERTLTFTTSTWATPQTVTARALDDADGVDEEVAIAHAAVGGDYRDVTRSLAARVSDDDERALVVAAPVRTLDEGGTASSSVRLSTQPTGPVTVAIAIPHPDVTVEAPAMLTFSTSMWNTAQKFTIRAGEDDDGEDETATLTLDPDGADYTGVAAATSTVTLVDNDLRGVTLSATMLSVPEGASADYAVRLATQPAGGDVTVTVGGAGLGITANPTALTFTGTNWRTPQTVTVRAAEDVNPTHESVVLTHAVSGADYGRENVAAGSVTATTVDNDAPSLYVAPTALALVEEGPGKTYAVRLNALPSGDVTVTVGGAGGGIAAIPTALTFTTSTWSALQTVAVQALADDDATNATTTLTHAVGGLGDYASLNAQARPGVQVTVDDDDTQGIRIDTDLDAEPDDGELALVENESAEYTVRLETQPTGPVTVTAASPDPALAVDTDGSPLERQLTFSTSTWATAQTVTAMAADDLDGGDETVTIAHAATGGDYGDVTRSLVAQVSDDDDRGVTAAAMLTLDEGGMASSTVRLATRPTGSVTVAITADHADVTVMPPTMLTFSTSTWDTAQTFAISAGEDDDGQDETATLTLAPDGADYTGVAAATSTVNLVDDDPRGVTLSAASVLVPEGGSTMYAVRLATQPFGGEVTVTVGGVPADGISASPTALTFTDANWRAQQMVTVSAAEDDDNSDTETAVLTHAVSGADYGATGVMAESVTATTTDNDRPSLRVAPTALTLTEEGASGAYAVRLNTLPTDSVTVTVGGAGGIVAVSPTALTFTTSTWSALQPVTVRALADDDATSATTTLTHAVGGLGDYASLNAEARPGVRVTVNDDDTPGLLIDTDPNTPEIDGGPLALNEQPGPGNAQQYTVRLETRPTAAVEVSIESGDGAVSVDGDETPRTRTLTFSTSTWDAAQTVTATAAQDDDASDEEVAIAHEASGGDYGDVSATLTAETMDDDAPALMLATSTLSAGVAEGSTATYTVRLATQPTGPVTVSATATGDATGAVELDVDGGQAGVQSSLRFDAANWNTARTATVRGLPDDDGADGTATLRHAASGSDYRDVSAPDETFAVIDDDAPAVLAGASSVAVNEGSTATYAVRLATRPVGGPVTVTATNPNTAAATVSPASMTFTGLNWSSPQLATVRGVADADTANATSTIAHAASGADYGLVPPRGCRLRCATRRRRRFASSRRRCRFGKAAAASTGCV